MAEFHQLLVLGCAGIGLGALVVALLDGPIRIWWVIIPKPLTPKQRSGLCALWAFLWIAGAAIWFMNQPQPSGAADGVSGNATITAPEENPPQPSPPPRPSEFRVPAGEMVDMTESGVLVDEWVMEDGSTLVISPDISTWTIRAQRAVFGRNTRIIAIGVDGPHGQDSNAHGGDGAECQDGGHGGLGSPGRNGGNAPSLDITIGLVDGNDLVIETRGGAGGNGGRGANGGRGGRASCGQICSGQEGGNGGRGGDAGSGGAAGDVTINYWYVDVDAGADAPSPIGELGSGIRVESSGGPPGVPGVGGRAGTGGDGRRCPPFNSIRRGSGAGGSDGANGSPAAPGADGRVVYNEVERAAGGG